MKTTLKHDQRMAKMTFASIYPHYVTKIEKKNRTKDELHKVIQWLTGFNLEDLKKFILLKGSTNEEYTLYTSHSTWDSKSDFENWKKSEAFRRAHSG